MDELKAFSKNVVNLAGSKQLKVPQTELYPFALVIEEIIGANTLKVYKDEKTPLTLLKTFKSTDNGKNFKVERDSSGTWSFTELTSKLGNSEKFPDQPNYQTRHLENNVTVNGGNSYQPFFTYDEDVDGAYTNIQFHITYSKATPPNYGRTTQRPPVLNINIEEIRNRDVFVGKYENLYVKDYFAIQARRLNQDPLKMGFRLNAASDNYKVGSLIVSLSDLPYNVYQYL